MTQDLEMYKAERLQLWRNAMHQLIDTMSVEDMLECYVNLDTAVSEMIEYSEEYIPENDDFSVAGLQKAFATLPNERRQEFIQAVMVDKPAETSFEKLLAIEQQFENLIENEEEVGEQIVRENNDEDEYDDEDDEEKDGEPDEESEFDNEYIMAAGFTSVPLAGGVVYTAIISNLGTLLYSLSRMTELFDEHVPGLDDQDGPDLAAPVYGPDASHALTLTMVRNADGIHLQFKNQTVSPQPLN